MLQIYYIQDYQKIEIIPWWGKKKVKFESLF